MLSGTGALVDTMRGVSALSCADGTRAGFLLAAEIHPCVATSE